MAVENLLAYVTKADGKEIRVHVVNSSVVSDLLSLGFVYDKNLGEYTIMTTDVSEKANNFDRLRVLGVCFSDGREWCPSEVFEYLRDQKKLSGTFKRISWRSPNDAHIVVV